MNNNELLASKIMDEIKATLDSFHKTSILVIISDDEKEFESLKKVCEYVGMSIMHFRYNDALESKIIRKIKELNKEETVNGIIISLPKKYDINKINSAISSAKNIKDYKNDKYHDIIINVEIDNPMNNVMIVYGTMEAYLKQNGVERLGPYGN